MRAVQESNKLLEAWTYSSNPKATSNSPQATERPSASSSRSVRSRTARSSTLLKRYEIPRCGEPKNKPDDG